MIVRLFPANESGVGVPFINPLSPMRPSWRERNEGSYNVLYEADPLINWNLFSAQIFLYAGNCSRLL